MAALVFTTTMWGLSFISTKVLLRRLAPIQVAFLRHAIASVAIWIAAAVARPNICLLYTSDAADDLLCVDLGGRRIVKKKQACG